MDKRVSILIDTFNGFVEVEAVAVGDWFAVHKAKMRRRWWTVTHRPSGRAVLSDIPTQHEALALAERIAKYARRQKINLRAKTARGMKRGNTKGFERFREYVNKVREEALL